MAMAVFSGALSAEHEQTPKVNVAFPDPTIFADKSVRPPSYLPNKARCYSALPVGDENGELPLYFAQLGAERGKGVRPIDPLKDLQNGDVLLTFDPTEPPENAIWDNLFKGTHHAMTVYRKDGEMFIVDSPKATPYKLYGMSYHVLRLRQYPPSIKSEADLQSALKDPAKRQEVENWQANRKTILESVSKYLDVIHANEYAYDNELKTEAMDPKALAALKKDFDRGVFPPDFKAYCSELPFTIYSMAGVKGITKTPLSEFVKNLKATLPQVKEEFPHLNDAEVIRAGVYQFINHPLVLTNLGVPKEEWPRLAQMGAAGFAKNPGVAGPKVAEMTGIVKKILSTPDWALSAGDTALSSFGGFFAADSTPVKLTKIVTPHCLGRQMFDPKSYFEYVGSNVECGPGAADANLIQPFPGGVGDATLARSQPVKALDANQSLTRVGDKKLAATLPMHSLQTQMRQITIGPKGYRTLSVGDDDTAVLTELSTGAPTVVGEADYRIAPTFSRDGLKAAWVSRDKQLNWLDMKTKATRKVLLDGETTAVHFTQGSDAIVRVGRNGQASLHPLKALDQAKSLDIAPNTLVSAVAPTGDILAAGTRGGEVRLVSLRSGEAEIIRAAQGPRIQVTRISFSPDGTRVAVATNSGKIDFYDTVSGTWIAGPAIDASDRGVTDVVFAGDGRSVVFSTAMGGIYSYDLTKKNLRSAVAPSANPTVVPKIAVSDDGKSLAAMQSDKAIAFYDLSGDAPVRTGVSTFARPVNDLKFVPGTPFALAASGLSAHLIGNHELVGSDLQTAVREASGPKDLWILKQLLTKAKTQKIVGKEAAQELLREANPDNAAAVRQVFESLFPGI